MSITQKIEESTKLMVSNRPSGELLSDVFSVLDGARVLCAEDTITDLQNAYYEGYTGNVQVRNLLVFDFLGTSYMWELTTLAHGAKVVLQKQVAL